MGAIQIHGPATHSYDIDLGVFPISDWYYGSVDRLLTRIADASNPFIPDNPGSPPPSDNVFFNGTNINPSGKGGKYSKITLTKGKRHRLRLINTSVDNTYTVSIVGHLMTIIQTDFVPIKPYTTNQIYMTIGQRHDVIIEANGKLGNYWMNVTFSSTGVCGGSNNAQPAAIVHYDGAPDKLPTRLGSPPVDSYCADNTEYAPIVDRHAPSTMFSVAPSNTLPTSMVVNTTTNQVSWAMNGSSINLSWDRPILEYVKHGDKSYMADQNVIDLSKSKEVSSGHLDHGLPIPPRTDRLAWSSGATGSSRICLPSPTQCIST